MLFKFSAGDVIAGSIFFAAFRAGDLAEVREEGAGNALHDQVTEVFEEARDDIFRYLITLGLYPPQAQEATQDVFLRLYLEMKKGEQILNARAWVFRAAHNLGLQIRAREDALRPFDPGIEEKLQDRNQTPEFSMIERERMLAINQAMKSLSPQQRQCMRLRAQGMRYHEIADTIGISISTVSEFLKRAILRLRKATNE